MMDQLHVRLDGKVIRVEVTGMPCVYNGLPCVQTLVRDVTQRKRAQRQVRRQRELLKKFFDRIPIMVAIYNSQRRMKLVNRAWKKTLGWNPKMSAEELLHACYPDAEERRRAISYIIKPVPGWTDFRIQIRDGRVLDTIWANFRISDGTLICIGQDVTEQRQIENALRQNQVELEQRVQNRTEELSSKNAELELEIGQRCKAETQLREKQGFLESLLRAHERDRQLVAYEIHDTFVQDVIGAIMFIDAFYDTCQATGETKLEHLDMARQSLRKAVGEARRMISGLRPPMIDEQGIVAAIEYLVHDAQSLGLALDFHHNMPAERLAPMLEATIFRIAQEAVKNVERHSQASSARIELVQEGSQVKLTISDKGLGFDPMQIPEGHYGVQGMQERARLVGGTLSIQSSPGLGTQVIAEFPLLMSDRHPVDSMPKQ
jgi:PAS domain S-box-containing protein